MPSYPSRSLQSTRLDQVKSKAKNQREKRQREKKRRQVSGDESARALPRRTRLLYRGFAGVGNEISDLSIMEIQRFLRPRSVILN